VHGPARRKIQVSIERYAIVDGIRDIGLNINLAPCCADGEGQKQKGKLATFHFSSKVGSEIA
jgi:hypothetical protein